MKKFLPYLFLFTYSTFMLKPVMPYIVDFVSHILNYQDHMATVHAHNGKYHVHYEIANAEKNDNNEKNAAILKKGGVGSDHVVSVNWSFFPVQQAEPVYFIPRLTNFSVIYLAKDYPPPRA